MGDKKFKDPRGGYVSDYEELDNMEIGLPEAVAEPVITEVVIKTSKKPKKKAKKKGAR